MIVLGGDEGIEFGIRVDEFKYQGCVLDEPGTNVAKYHREVASAIRSLVNVMGLQLECVSQLHEGLLVPILLYGSETMIWREKDMSTIRVVQMDDFRGLLSIRRMDRILNVRIRDMQSG